MPDEKDDAASSRPSNDGYCADEKLDQDTQDNIHWGNDNCDDLDAISEYPNGAPSSGVSPSIPGVSKVIKSKPSNQNIHQPPALPAGVANSPSAELRIQPRRTSDPNHLPDSSAARNAATTGTTPTADQYKTAHTANSHNQLGPSKSSSAVSHNLTSNPFADSSSRDKEAPPGKSRLQWQVPNASQGKEFSATITPKIPQEYGLISLTDLDLDVSQHPETGVNIEVKERTVEFSGVPSCNGDIRLTFNHKLPKGVGHHPESRYSGEVVWYINPDPRSLWKQLEPEASLPFRKPHTSHQLIDCPGTLVAASVRGRSHAHDGSFRDDDFALDHDLATGWYLLAVCDGAGSAKYSRRGSEIAVEVVQRQIKSQFSGPLSDSSFATAVENYCTAPSEQAQKALRLALYDPLGGTAMKAYKAIQEESKNFPGSEVKDFATTLVFTITKRFPVGWFAGAYCIGDGGAVMYSEKSGIVPLNSPDGGEFAGQTRFLTMSDNFSTGEKVMSRIRFGVQQDLTAILAMTDGVSDPKFQTDENFGSRGLWDAFWNDLNSNLKVTRQNSNVGNELVQWLDFWSPGNHDDRTLAILRP